ncbi:hypothetical protein GCM10007973_04860 [Polymorphobacter multimanifer]|uniref:Cholesterol transport system auxiliary component n=1 Tax=Polymorphobacter multimanifer TaxID=1070431 RepID=A0A841L4Y5_9SPHN|nr:ABC-type transport auxiliary lipoprotein family protein [Polymorphobacter multimanifer]MBB6227684.1 cholesterol transport system auxiliary component [Polymorphobacter multimanifer]GGI70912.1 hypothetical protein GCM10007973_04860 [Polymorphobacter multimanifer]
MKPLRVILVLLPVVVAGCGPLVQIGAKGPPAVSLLLVEATATPTGVQAKPGSPTIAVDLPLLPAMLQTLRVAVRISDTEIQYLTAAGWAETPNRQVQRLFSDTLAARGLPVLDRSQVSPQPQATLSGALRDFTLDVRDPLQPIVRVRYDAQLSHPNQPRGPDLRRFEASEPVASQAPADVAAALSRAINRLAGDLADWTVANI